jgi:HEAT repeat protein/DNA-directed RNA polymerase subunit RPC12/RpoP
MAKYQYRCPNCGTEVELRMRVTQTKRRCSYCNIPITTEEIDRQKAERDRQLAEWLQQEAERRQRRALYTRLGCLILIAVPVVIIALGVWKRDRGSKLPDKAPNPAAAMKGPASPTIWINALEGTAPIGDLRVRITKVRPNDARLLISLQIDNVGREWGLGYRPLPPGAEPERPRLTDDHGNHFRWIPPTNTPAPFQAVQPGKSVAEVLSFDCPRDNVEYLRLELPAAAFGGTDRLGFQLPRNMLLFITARHDKDRAVPALCRALADPDPEIRSAAATAIAEVGPDAVSVRHDLLKRLEDDDHFDVRVAAARALGSIGSGASDARPELIHASRGQDTRVKLAAVEALKALDPPTKAEIPALLSALTVPELDVRIYCVLALGKLGRDSHAAVGALLPILRDDDPGLRSAAATALGGIAEENDARVTRELCRLLDEDLKDSVRQKAAQSLTQLGGCREATTRLIKALGDRDGKVAEIANGRLTNATLDREQIRELGNALERRNSAERLRASILLAALSAKAVPAKKSLIVALHDTDKSVSLRAAETLGKMRADAWDAVRPLARLLDHEDLQLRQVAVRALGEIGPNAKASVPALIRGCSDDRRGITAECHAALLKIGRNAVPDLIEVLHSNRPNAQKVEACRILGDIGSGALEAIATLESVAEDKNIFPSLRRAAREAIRKISP